MNHYEQRRAVALQHPRVEAGYQGMEAEIATLHYAAALAEKATRGDIIGGELPPPGGLND